MRRLRSSLRLLATTLLLVIASLDSASSSTGYIICSCKVCKANPSVECQISPDGYSILCADWLRTHSCPST